MDHNFVHYRALSEVNVLSLSTLYVGALLLYRGILYSE